MVMFSARKVGSKINGPFRVEDRINIVLYDTGHNKEALS